METKYYIAGPCAAESREQVRRIAQAILHLQGTAVIFRAGIWKPRTSPTTFQGIGQKGLSWLKEIEDDFGLPCMTEVATPEQLRLALEAGLTRFWIGARTSADPQAVQAIANAIDERVRLVAIKNPVNEDLDLWLGNIERIVAAPHVRRTNVRCTKEEERLEVIAVHRGCDHRPCWGMAYKLHQLRPDIPLLLDPSHLSGKAEDVPALMDTAEALGLDGTMVEVHDRPQEALSDGRQQVLPTEWAKNLSPTLSSREGEKSDSERELLWLRLQIDEIDKRLWESLAQRMEIVRSIGAVKKTYHLDAYQPERYHQLLQQRLLWAQEKGLPTEVVQPILEAIHEAAIKLQR